MTPAEQRLIARALKVCEARIIGHELVTSPAAMRDYLRLKLAPLEYEEFGCVWLDSQRRVIGIEHLFRGTLTQTAVYPRELAKSGLRLNASGVVLFHNHPSGTPEPSTADRFLTTKIRETLGLLDIEVLDHMIVGTTIYSFAEKGLL